MNDQDQEIIREFVLESNENLSRLDQEIVELESTPRDAALLASVFRTMHTLKGTCGFLGYTAMESVAHHAENILSQLRNGKRLLDEDLTTVILAAVDMIRVELTAVEQNGTETGQVYESLLARLREVEEQASLAEQPAPAGETVGASFTGASLPASDSQRPDSKQAIFGKDEASTEPQTDITVLPLAHSLDPRQPALENDHVGSRTVERSTGISVPSDDGSITHGASFEAEASASRPFPFTETMASPMLPTANLREGKTASEEDEETASAQTKSKGVTDSAIRVDVMLLDKLMNLVGELVLARNQILQYNGTQEDPALNATSQRLDLITTELQEGVMKTRMQPIGVVWGKLPRVVRDLAASCSKQIRLEMDGAETELDKTIIEAIKDPLTHIVRNSCDHGIEEPAQRVAAGKPAQGRLSLRAFHEGGHVNIEISDDGRGIDPERVRHRAIERGMLSQESASRATERELLQLIFAPGFSTAQQVSSISGRGVGMDVVRTNIEKIGGNVDVSSAVGTGTTVRLKIPLTLAIIPGLVISHDNDRYVIPQVSLLELIRLEGEQCARQIERIHGIPVYRRRGKLLPLAFLADIFQNHPPGSSARLLLASDRNNETANVNALPGGRGAVDGRGAVYDSGDAGAQTATSGNASTHTGAAGSSSAVGSRSDAVNIVVLQAETQQFGLVVDGINDTQEIVVKPLGNQLKGLTCYAGATIMGDGKVALILDVMGIGQLSGVLTRSSAVSESSGELATHVEEMQSFLLFSAGSYQRLAVPLALVARLEEFPSDVVESAAGYQVIQYRGEILPIVPLTHILEPGARTPQEPSESQPVRVVVFSEASRSVGVLVDQILDIVEGDMRTRRISNKPGILASVVLGGKVTDLLDLKAVLSQENVDLFGSQASKHTQTVLVAEPVAFRRNLLRTNLQLAGYRVKEAASTTEMARQLDQDRVDVALISMSFDQVEGRPLHAWIREQHRRRDWAAVAMLDSGADGLSDEMKESFDAHESVLDHESMLRSIERLRAHTNASVATAQSLALVY